MRSVTLGWQEGGKDEGKISQKESPALPTEGESDKEMSGNVQDNSDIVPDLDYWHRQLWAW